MLVEALAPVPDSVVQSFRWVGLGLAGGAFAVLLRWRWGWAVAYLVGFALLSLAGTLAPRLRNPSVLVVPLILITAGGVGAVTHKPRQD
jgi:uncharacterized membrane protein YjjP (DUF1212 family)